MKNMPGATQKSHRVRVAVTLPDVLNFNLGIAAKLENKSKAEVMREALVYYFQKDYGWDAYRKVEI